MLNACAIVPALNAAATIGSVVAELRERLGIEVLVVDDGCADETERSARDAGARVLTHIRNRGKGAAIRTGLLEAARLGFNAALTVDADGQHPADSAARVLGASDDASDLVLGIRDLVRDGAPASNRFGNAASNYFLSHFAGRPLRDTQCGLRRYPIGETLALGAKGSGFTFEGEVVLRAVARGLRVVEVPVHVVYPALGKGATHFRRVLDPVRIVLRVTRTVLELRFRRT